MEELLDDKIQSNVGSKISDFKVLSELGRGSYGVVYKVQSNINRKFYVIKKMILKHMKEKQQKESWKEVNLLKKMHHKNIIKYYTSFLEEDSLYIVMEYADGGDLYTLIKEHKKNKSNFSQDELWRFALQIIQGVEYLHANNIIHRDIKCLNLLFTKDKQIKIGDLGVSKLVSSANALHNTRVGTPLYLSPELIKQIPYDFKIDLWSVGCSLYHLAALEPPFNGDNLIILGNNIVKSNPKKLPLLYTKEYGEFVERLMSKKPENRPTAKESLSFIPFIIREEFKKKKNKFGKNEEYSNSNEIIVATEDKNLKMKRNDPVPINNTNDIINTIHSRPLSGNQGNLALSKNKKDIAATPNIISNENIKNSTNLADNALDNRNLYENLNIKLNTSISKNLNKIHVKNVNFFNKKQTKINENGINTNLFHTSNNNQINKNRNISLIQKVENFMLYSDDNEEINRKQKINNNDKVHNQPEKISELKKETMSVDFKYEKNIQFEENHKRLLSAEFRPRNKFRPNTASNNKILFQNNIVGKKLNEIDNLNQIPYLKNNRPFTAVNKDINPDNNVINININVYNIDMNQRFLKPDPTRNLLYIDSGLVRQVKGSNSNNSNHNFFSERNSPRKKLAVAHPQSERINNKGINNEIFIDKIVKAIESLNYNNKKHLTINDLK